ncbi:hypothetical protein ABIQ69_01245 [Agromyces sp. G08B096]|uniref:Uncharacterized protein n=1 Tax=Agromyces sp. G08B096 TaxID=3156399 RepID=A0AAU7W9I1_9MICO
MSVSTHRRRRLLPSRRGAARASRERAVVTGGVLAVVALCAVGAGFGAYAAIGDGAGPAALGGQIGLAAPTDPAPGGVVADGRSEVGDTDGTPVAGSPEPGTAPPSAAPHPSPSPTPAPTPEAPEQSTHPDPADPLSPAYNPYTTPGDPAFVTETARSQWLGQQEVVRQCMRDAGFEYLPWQWWEGGSPMPPGLSDGAQAAWMTALRGAPEPAPDGSSDPGCEAVAQGVADEAKAAGTPLSAPLPERDPAAPTPRERWLEFQDAVRACMAEAGQEYRYWEFWNPEFSAVDGSPAMPPGLTDAERAAWNTAAFGSPDAAGQAAPLDHGGCWTEGARAVDYREFD